MVGCERPIAFVLVLEAHSATCSAKRCHLYLGVIGMQQNDAEHFSPGEIGTGSTPCLPFCVSELRSSFHNAKMIRITGTQWMAGVPQPLLILEKCPR